MNDHNDMTEADVCMRLIDPLLEQAGWNRDYIRREHKITNGRIVPHGKSGKRNNPLKADYVLGVANNYPIAVVEAKTAYKEPGDGMQQALDYADKLKLKFAYATNGYGIVEYDFITKKQTTIKQFPTPEELLKRLQQNLDFDDQKMKTLLSPFDRSSPDPTGKVMEPRYYQEIAINAATQAILGGKKRILLTMATGTGKTFVAFQLAHKLWKNILVNSDADVRPRHPKILFLADRNVLLTQAQNNAFEPFRDARHRIQSTAKDSYDMYFALYQALDVDQGEEQLYKKYAKDFFDYIIIDECHRGSSTEGGEWRKVLEHFDTAVHIGMTATPKRDEDDMDTYDYFKQPIYTYSLKQGIEDGFLAPYMIHQVHLEIDQTGYTPSPGEKDLDGKELEQKIYGIKDFDRILKIDERRKTVADNLIRFLDRNDAKYDKTILFCQNSEHALAMTEYLRSFSGERYDYAVRIVSAEGKIGKEYLEKFQTPNTDFPVIAVTSKLLSTGVDVPTCRVIALDKVISSMTEFKQIIGRGTRVFEPKDKMWFTILDYRNATRLFKDDEWDGPAEDVTEEEQETLTKEKEGRIKRKNKGQIKPPPQPEPEPIPPPREKIEIYHIAGNKIKITGESVLIFDQSINGNRLISYTDYTGEQVRRLVNDDETKLYKIWIEPEKRHHFIKELNTVGVTFEHIREITKHYNVDAFDLLLHFAFDSILKTRIQRVDGLRKKAFLEKYPEKAHAVLNVILDHYAEQGYQELEGRGILAMTKFQQFGGPSKIIEECFDGKYDDVIKDIIKELYIHN